MRKIILLLLLILFAVPLWVTAQKKVDSLVTKSGFVIRDGDMIELGTGTRDDGRFKFIQVSDGNKAFSIGMVSTLFPDARFHLPANFSGRKIKKYNGRNIPVLVISKVMGMENRVDLLADEAIAIGEIIVPVQYRPKKETPAPPQSKADELIKLKKLLDDGVLTKEEFESEKKKVLEK